MTKLLHARWSFTEVSKLKCSLLVRTLGVYIYELYQPPPSLITTPLSSLPLPCPHRPYPLRPTTSERLRRRKKVRKDSVITPIVQKLSTYCCRGIVEYAAVPVIDFAKVHTAEDRAELVPQVRDAMRTCGFMCVVNHGLTQAQVSSCGERRNIKDGVLTGART